MCISDISNLLTRLEPSRRTFSDSLGCIIPSGRLRCLRKLRLKYLYPALAVNIQPPIFFVCNFWLFPEFSTSSLWDFNEYMVIIRITDGIITMFDFCSLLSEADKSGHHNTLCLPFFQKALGKTRSCFSVKDMVTGVSDIPPEYSATAVAATDFWPTSPYGYCHGYYQNNPSS